MGDRLRQIISRSSGRLFVTEVYCLLSHGAAQVCDDLRSAVFQDWCTWIHTGCVRVPFGGNIRETSKLVIKVWKRETRKTQLQCLHGLDELSSMVKMEMVRTWATGAEE